MCNTMVPELPVLAIALIVPEVIAPERKTLLKGFSNLESSTFFFMSNLRSDIVQKIWRTFFSLTHDNPSFSCCSNCCSSFKLKPVNSLPKSRL